MCCRVVVVVVAIRNKTQTHSTRDGKKQIFMKIANLLPLNSRTNDTGSALVWLRRQIRESTTFFFARCISCDSLSFFRFAFRLYKCARNVNVVTHSKLFTSGIGHTKPIPCVDLSLQWQLDECVCICVRVAPEVCESVCVRAR